MRKLLNTENLNAFIFSAGIILSLILIIHPEVKVLILILPLIPLLYLTLGWFLFRTYFPEGETVLLFLMGFLYAGVFMGSLFKLSDWPKAGTFSAVAVFWALLQLALVILNRKRIPARGFFQFTTEAILLLILSVVQVVAT